MRMYVKYLIYNECLIQKETNPTICIFNWAHGTKKKASLFWSLLISMINIDVN